MQTALITSAEPQEVSVGQKDNCAGVIADAARKATRAELDALAESGTLNSVNMQNVLAGGGRIAAAAAETVRLEIREIASGILGCLKLISGGKRTIIKATKGTETLASAADLFGTNIDSEFVHWGCDGTEEPTKDTQVEVYEMFENADYRRIFGGFGQNLDQLCVTTCQAKRFIADEAGNYLREDGWAVFLFLFKVKAKKQDEKDAFFVAYVEVSSDGRRFAYVHRFAFAYLWSAGPRFRVVLPQLTLGA